ncbi:MAG: ABC transporter substrate-binding protein, partial [Rhodospirillales bacterium]|nr:ABC transporter substrate-binding protein [Rhodospirillales bacterium]
MKALCFKSANACKWTKDAPPYDPVAAKKLLAEAGYPNGFDVEITALTGLLKPVGEAMSGAFRKIGVRAKVQTLSFGVYRKKSNTGKLQVLAGWYTSSGYPEGSMWLDFFFSPTGRNYWRDKEIDAIRRKGNSILDPAKRREIFKEAFDLINKKVYMVPISTTPGVLAHTKEIRLKPGGLTSFGVTPGDIFWK